MINQIAPITQALPGTINKDLIKVRRIQHKLKAHEPTPDYGYLWSPLTAGPVVVPVTRWIE